MELKFNTYGNEKQKLAASYWIDPEVFDICYGGSKGNGKSYLGCSLIFGDAFIYPETHYFIARKKLNDLRKFTVPSIFEVFEHWGIHAGYYNFNATDNVFTLYNKSKVFLIEAAYQPSDPNYQRFGSMQMTRGWIEEAGEFEEEAKNNLAASIGRWKNDVYNLPGKLLQTCNPSKNYLYREYYKKNRDGILEPWKRFIQALPTDNKKIAVEYIENLRRILSKNERMRLLDGNWEYDDDPNALCDYENICNIFTNEFVPRGSKFITADIARFGKDTTTIRVWEGWRVVKRVCEKGLKVTESAQLIRNLATEYTVPMSSVIVDEDGIGGGVVDILGCVGFVANSRPLPTGEFDDNGREIVGNFDMLKSQCGFRLSEKIRANEVYEKADGQVRERIIEEFEQLKQKSLDSDGKKGLMPKDEIKSLIGRSPDELDDYIMRAYFDLKPKPSAPIMTFHR